MIMSGPAWSISAEFHYLFFEAAMKHAVLPDRDPCFPKPESEGHRHHCPATARERGISV